MKTPKLLIAVLAIALFIAVTPAAAQSVAPYEPSGKGTFAAGTGPLVFESQIPGNEWKVKADGTYTLVQPWHSPGGPYNPNLDMSGLSWKQAIDLLDSKGWNSGSLWFVPAKKPAESSAPATSGSDNGTAPAAKSSWNWLWCLAPLALLGLLGVLLWRHRHHATPAPRSSAPPTST